MERRYRLQKNKAFQYVYHRGRSAACRDLVMLVAKGRGMKVGFSVSKKVGNAVTRNKVKRRLRECFRPYLGDVKSGLYVVVARPSAATASFSSLQKDVRYLLKKHGVEWNGMAVVNDYNADYPLDFYNFFKEIGCHYIQFAPIVERIAPHGDGRHLASLADKEKSTQLADFSVTPEQWGDFLCALFDEWVKQDVGTYYIQLFDSTLANWIGEQPGVCSMAKTCGHAGVMEFNGDVYSCDHFVFPEYRLGNIYQKTLVEMMYSPEQQRFGQHKQDSLPRQCRECEFLFACNGECPKNRFMHTADGEAGLNYLCKGYRQFFKHVAPYMDFMKKELMAQRPPANVMEWIKQQ